MMGTLKKLAANEPLRLRVYTLAALVLGYLVSRHVLSPADVDFYLAVAALVLGVETARAKVTPSDKVDLFTKGK
jgi:hypothetical protein